MTWEIPQTTWFINIIRVQRAISITFQIRHCCHIFIVQLLVPFLRTTDSLQTKHGLFALLMKQDLILAFFIDGKSPWLQQMIQKIVVMGFERQARHATTVWTTEFMAASLIVLQELYQILPVSGEAPPLLILVLINLRLTLIKLLL